MADALFQRAARPPHSAARRTVTRHAETKDHPMRRAQSIATLAVAGLTLAGCQTVDQASIAAQPLVCPEDSDCYDPAIPIGPGGAFSIEAGDLFFRNLTGVAIDGANEVTITNIGQAEHNIKIDQAAGENKKVTALGGETNVGELLLYAGTYTYYCDIAGHRAAGMEGTIEVLEPGESASAEAPGTEEDTAGAGPADADVEGEAEDDTQNDPDVQPDEEPPLGEDAEAALADDAATVLADGVDDQTIERLDDSDDVAAALDERGAARLYQVTFASNSAEVTSDADDVLTALAAYLAERPDVRLRIEGNTDSSGSAEANQDLSARRALAVRDALLDLGVDAGRLEPLGNGEDNLLVDDTDDPTAQQVNRRVEVFLVP